MSNPFDDFDNHDAIYLYDNSICVDQNTVYTYGDTTVEYMEEHNRGYYQNYNGEYDGEVLLELQPMESVENVGLDQEEELDFESLITLQSDSGENGGLWNHIKSIGKKMFKMASQYARVDSLFDKVGEFDANQSHECYFIVQQFSPFEIIPRLPGTHGWNSTPYSAYQKKFLRLEVFDLNLDFVLEQPVECRYKKRNDSKFSVDDQHDFPFSIFPEDNIFN